MTTRQHDEGARIAKRWFTFTHEPLNKQPNGQSGRSQESTFWQQAITTLNLLRADISELEEHVVRQHVLGALVLLAGYLVPESVQRLI
jgi:hypothetical protein